MITIALDAMGGDFGAEPIVTGAVQALYEKKGFRLILVGDRDEIEKYLPKKRRKLKDRLDIVESSDVISMEDSATDVFKRKESSIYRAVDLVRNGKADAVVSAGHSGATMSLATLRIGRIPKISRPAIAAYMPTKDGKRSLVLDVGANVDCKPEHLFQFGIMGEVYAREILGIQNPKVGLLSNGEEDSKGNELTKASFKLLKKLPSFKGNVEGNNIFDGSVDVIVCDGFVGNLVLKTSEGVAETISDFIKKRIKKSAIAIAGAILMKKVFRLLKKEIDYAEYGGAPLLGLKACTIISHGKSNPKAIKNAIFQAISYVNGDIESKIEEKLKNI
ncbi:MAG TPA: phosphate acyltransferase PlsX [Campylobacterales bacterium]|nr:phosphate acyltransferase PlsX [Campylobacterales bacterium]HIO70784.1 phosphate acyltransferase PlsX [Campylobacterales bacterium]